MTGHAKQLVIVRGGGDIATGIIHGLYRCEYSVLVLESGYPSTIRRYVVFSEAVCDSMFGVGGITCVEASGHEKACAIMEQGVVPIMIDENCAVLEKMCPWVLVDAILAKRNLEITRDMTDKTIGFRPSFMAGRDVDLVIETMRGHNLGHIIGNGSTAPNTGVLGAIGGYGAERATRAPVKGVFFDRTLIGDMMEQGQATGVIVTEQGEVTVETSLTRLLRGIIRDGYPVVKGLKIANVDLGKSEYENYFTISGKARRITDSMVEGLQMLEVGQGY